MSRYWAYVLVLLMFASLLIPQQPVVVSKSNSTALKGLAISAREYVLRALPQLKAFLSPEPSIKYLGVDRALNLPTLKVVWNLSQGVYVEVGEVMIEGAWTPYTLYVELRPTNSSISSLLGKESAEMISSLRNRYNELVRDATNNGVRIVGFGIYVNSTPVGILEPGPYIVAAKLYWGVRVEGPITAYALLDYYPILKYFINKTLPTYSVSIREAVSKLSEVSETSINESDVMKYLLIVNGSLRIAYVAYLNPYELAIVFGDNGELLYPGNYSGRTTHSPLHRSGAVAGSKYSMNYLTYIIVGLVIASAAIAVWFKVRRI